MPLTWQRSNEKELGLLVDEEAFEIVTYAIAPLGLDEPTCPDAIAERLYDSLRQLGIAYDPLPPVFAQAQRVRTHAEVFSLRKGNCVDLSTMFTALALHHGLFSALVVFDGHALVLIDRTVTFDGSFKTARPDQRRIFANAGLLLTDGLAELQQLVERNAFLAIECTGFAIGAMPDSTAPEWSGREAGVMSFERATHAGREQLLSPPAGRNFRFALDLRLLREAGITRSGQALATTLAGLPTAADEQTFVERVAGWLRTLEFELPPGWPADHSNEVDVKRRSRDSFDKEIRLHLKISTSNVTDARDLMTWYHDALTRDTRNSTALAYASLHGFDPDVGTIVRQLENLYLLTPRQVDPAIPLRPLLERLVNEYLGVTPPTLIPVKVPLQHRFVVRRGFERKQSSGNGYDIISIHESVPHQPAPKTPFVVDYDRVGTWIDRNLNDDNRRAMVIVGDSRHGKTALLFNLWYQLAQRYVDGHCAKGSINRLPLYVRLRNFSGGPLFDFLTTTLNSTYEVEFERRWLKRLFDEGRLVLLLDGLDENGASLQANYDEIMTAIELAPNSKVILSTSRGAFAEAHNASTMVGPYDKPMRGKKNLLALLELRPYRLEDVPAIAKRREPDNWEDFMAAARAHPEPKDFLWPGNLATQLDAWRPGQPIQPISKALEQSADIAAAQGGWDPDLKRALLRRLAFRISTSEGLRPFSLRVSEARAELASLPGMEGVDEITQYDLLLSLADNVILATTPDEIEFLERSWLDYYHAEYLVALAEKATTFDELVTPPMDLSETAEFTRSLVLHHSTLQDRIEPLIPSQPRGGVDTWLFWRELMKPERPQEEFDQEDERRRDAQRRLTESHGQTLARIANLGIRAVIVPGARFIRGGWEIAPKHTIPHIVRPPRIIRVSNFMLGAFLVTNKQFQEFVDETNYSTQAERGSLAHVIGPNDKFTRRNGLSWRDPRGAGMDVVASAPDHPVVQITREDAMAYCRWLSARLGQDVDLPTEAQWELAARGSLGRLYPWGNLDWDRTRANCANLHVDSATEDELKKWWALEKPAPLTTPVTQFPPNVIGLYDMAGNVWEWTADWFETDFYSSGPEDDPRTRDEGEFQIIRGGGWDDIWKTLKCYWRYPARPGESSDNVGFRLAFLIDDLGASGPMEPET